MEVNGKRLDTPEVSYTEKRGKCAKAEKVATGGPKGEMGCGQDKPKGGDPSHRASWTTRDLAQKRQRGGDSIDEDTLSKT